jgi:hypothetical protein
MDISKAVAEPFVQFLDFHDAFNHQFKAGVTAIRHISAEAAGPNGPAVRTAFLSRMEKNWRDRHDWSSASAVLDRAAEDACGLAIVQIHSALDDFSTALRAEHSRWCAVAGIAISPRLAIKAPNEEDEPLWKLCQDLGLQSANVVAWRPLLALFRVMRNCIAHSSGKASGHLASLASSPALGQVLQSWPRRPGSKSPPAPAIFDSQQIRVPPKTVILCLNAAYRVCEYINEHFRVFLGVQGMCYSAAYFCLLNPDRQVLSTSYRTANRAVGHTLSTRYQVTGASQILVSQLQALGVWNKCVRRHARLYRNSVEAGLFKPPHGFKMPA